MNVLRRYLSFIRFSHTIFALPFVAMAAILAWHDAPSGWQFRELLGLLLCMVFARSAAMAFNRIVDRKIDAANPRTANRHLPSREISLQGAIVFTALSAAGFVLSTLLFLPNAWPVILSVPVLLFLLGYSLAKRFTIWCHYWLSAALMLSPIATWIALRGTVETPAIALAAVIFFWVGGFDILYACQDADFDRERNLHSIPARIGLPNALRAAAFSHLLAAASLFLFWYLAGLGPVFLMGCVAVSLLLLYEHSIVQADNLTRVNIAFFNVNAVISLGLLAVLIADLLAFSRGV